ncbi:unnamed protein product [Acanthoscelides obtectus]|uniref:Uncharacterized protein n=1 Tax=Acanthoscelides obtectus TaxID=200917 RepID=A0A9P0L282_ACAOB|nr:unnamed protein product [Acanthoscelides obtectus]CAK1650201.1 hypothetical protein AOBTE_LOCUS16679 [Acanthoscelides obtectus]
METFNLGTYQVRQRLFCKIINTLLARKSSLS